MTKTIINFAPTGMVPQKEDNPHVPLSPNEIIEDVHQAFELGITLVHLHARDSQGKPDWKKNTYQSIFEGIRKHCPGLVICATSSGRDFPEFEKRSAVIELQPDMCSLTLSSLNFLTQASINDPNMIVSLAEKMKEYGVVPELECFDLGMINYGKYLIKKGIIEGPVCYWNLLFGNIAGFQGTLSEISTALSLIPSTDYVALAGLGTQQLPVNTVAISQGLGVRVGLEDNIWWDSKRSRVASNFELLKRVHTMMEIHDSQLFSAKEFGTLGFYNRKLNRESS